MRYPSAKRPLIGVIFLITSLFLLGCTATIMLEAGGIPALIMLIILIVVIWYFYGIWFRTHYEIIGNVLHYRFGLDKGHIPIASIHKIVYNKKFYSYGNKPALDMRAGLIVHYNRWDEIYISPANRAAFVQELQKINPQIEVEG